MRLTIILALVAIAVAIGWFSRSYGFVAGALAVIAGIAADLFRERDQEIEALILRLLADGKECFGLDLVEASGGKLRRGSIYAYLHRLENAGLIESREAGAPTYPGGPVRRLYRRKG